MFYTYFWDLDRFLCFTLIFGIQTEFCVLHVFLGFRRISVFYTYFDGFLCFTRILGIYTDFCVLYAFLEFRRISVFYTYFWNLDGFLCFMFICHKKWILKK